ncbi:NADH-quinone oxidoreductase subunit L [Polycladomyces sp. WAk]|uniref:NADH-quinone oxidoreductase subunit L n=1 Tax=Polycladomyces zharkentensis TaxID=2807616 RepID=A0ABS2WF24_9BACL|nr:NADH-quinone oxidoreductase subunit L [Polycladomyces sp. WAk]MBN2908039.1 NADH-quinone oxidoreductase subunit L [Polycladomyces sp. WAk]
MIAYVWIIPLFPLIAFLLLIAGRRRWSENAAAVIGITATLASFLASVAVLAREESGTTSGVQTFPWLKVGNTVFSFGTDVNHLNLLMLVIVSLVSFLVHVYARGYMHGDPRFTVFYAYLTLFTFSMLGLVISPNLLQLYIFWELVGVCSFLLVGFWYHKPEAKAAAKKAFIVTRVGDVGLFIAIALLFWQVGSLDIASVLNAIEAGKIPPALLTWIAVLIFVGAVGKSGQFPLHTWLPDAMEGPTPVSALIHAATMVAAGVYLVARLFPLFAASETAMDVVAYVGAFTAIFAASIGLVQHDIKRVLAYSTVSQLGYMMLSLGSAGYVAGVFHLMTHAFFKALLFLGAGAVIIALHHEQDIRRMGGLWRKNKAVGWMFLIGCLAISGIPPFAGFFSKDEILAAAYADGRTGVFLVGLLAALFTAFYVFRLFFLVFTGEYRGQAQVQPVPAVMILPMAVLALLSVVGGFANAPVPLLGMWLTEGVGVHETAVGTPLWVSLCATLVSLAGLGVAWMMYGRRAWSPAAWRERMPILYQLLYRKYYIDEIYRAVFVAGLRNIGRLFRGFDRWIVEGLVGLAVGVTRMIAWVGSRLQNGQVQAYALISLIGLVLLLAGLTAGRLFG